MPCLKGTSLVLLVLCGVLTHNRYAEAYTTGAEDEVKAAVQSYVAAFNSRDAKAVASLWAENAIHTIRNSGEKTTGRTAIEGQFAALFSSEDVTKLTVAVESVRLVTDNVAKVEGAAVVVVGNEEPSETSFSALFIKSNDKWLMESVDETVMTVDDATIDPLAELEWMIGQWEDASQDVSVNTSVRWSANNSFLIRNYSLTREDQVEMQGTQVIGWDPKEGQIRSWAFDSDGSFGEGTWSRNGDSWIVKMSRTLADGGSASGTQVITANNENSMTVRIIGQDINGAPVPASDAIQVVRVAADQ